MLVNTESHAGAVYFDQHDAARRRGTASREGDDPYLLQLALQRWEAEGGAVMEAI